MIYAKIGHLKNHLSKYVNQVREGGEVLILDRDTPVARIVPLSRGAEVGADGERLARLERLGVVRRGVPVTRGRRGPAVPPSGAGGVLAALLAERKESL